MRTPVLYGDQIGAEVLTPTSATGFTASLLTHTDGRKAQVAVIVPTAQPINYRCDGTAAVAGAGGYATVGQELVITGPDNIVNFSCIDTSAGASTVFVLFYF